ncbi:DUF3054 domain-containing protein [Halalkalicoccus salilacus]|uniref:DUF3054 domain-containing protein n=1 Tax=Halalkalicoccus sp. GCM10025704 TaxID=3252662 RepID=UPI0036195AD3
MGRRRVERCGNREAHDPGGRTHGHVPRVGAVRSVGDDRGASARRSGDHHPPALRGLRSHGVDPLASPAYTAETVAPFLLGWLVVAPLLGVYTARVRESFAETLLSVGLAWIVAALAGIGLRATPGSRAAHPLRSSPSRSAWGWRPCFPGTCSSPRSPGEHSAAGVLPVRSSSISAILRARITDLP